MQETDDRDYGCDWSELMLFLMLLSSITAHACEILRDAKQQMKVCVHYSVHFKIVRASLLQRMEILIKIMTTHILSKV